MRAKIEDLTRTGRISDKDAATQLRQLDTSDDENQAQVASWLRERGAAHAAFRTGMAAEGASLLHLRSRSGDMDAEVQLEGEYVGANNFFANLLSNHWNSGSSVVVSRRWLPFCPTLLRYLHSPQPLFVDQLMFQQTLESALALHHCALYFLAAGEFFLEFFHIVRARQHILLQGLDLEGGDSSLLFPEDQSGDCFDIYHLPLQGVLMWLVALGLSGAAAARVLREVGSLGNVGAAPDALKAAVEEVAAVLEALFSPDQEYWQVVLHGTFGLGLSEFEKAEEQERRRVNLDCLHSLATRLRSDLLQSAPDLLPSGSGAGQATDLQGTEGEERAKAMAAAEDAFGQYLDGAHGFKALCSVLDIPCDGFSALALAFCCGSADAHNFSSRQGFLGAVASQPGSGLQALQALVKSTTERTMSQPVVPEFWDWLFRALSSFAPSVPGDRACRKNTLYDRPAAPAKAAVVALCAAAPCLGSPPLLRLLADFLSMRGSNLSRDTWQMMRVFLVRFPSMQSLEDYNDLDGEFPCLLDSFVEEMRKISPPTKDQLEKRLHEEQEERRCESLLNQQKISLKRDRVFDD